MMTHNREVAGSNPAPATTKTPGIPEVLKLRHWANFVMYQDISDSSASIDL